MQAILFDTRSIQRYIFSGNKLRTNIGASYIVSEVFQEVLVDKILKGSYDVDESWRKHEVDFSAGLDKPCAVAYIGGGNALVLFRDADEEECKRVVYAFTKQLLYDYPGLSTGAAIGNLDLADDESYRRTYQELHGKLKRNQNTIFPQVNIPYTGLTHLCDVNGEAANAHEQYQGEDRYISQETWAKNRKSQDAQEALESEFKEALGQNYVFPRELEKLGQTVGEDYIAVVHIDGNNMGKRFGKLHGLKERIEFSKAVTEKTKNSFSALLKDVVKTSDWLRGLGEREQKLLGMHLQKEGTCWCLPRRPLILRGDDVTFICAAKIALPCAIHFMEYMRKADADKEADKEIDRIDCCAGIAIRNTSYPFFRAYEMAEQACGEAKKKSRETPGSSWLEFVLLHGEQASTLGEIRKTEYRGAWIGNMHFGPYEVGGNRADEHNIQCLMDCLGKLYRDTKDQKLAKNKLKDMRYVLQQGVNDIRDFQEQMWHVGQGMPSVAGWEKYEQALWAECDGVRRTPYVDAVEMLEFYLPMENGVIESGKEQEK